MLVQELGVWAKGKAGDNPNELSASYVSEPTHLASHGLVQLVYGRPF